MSSDFYFREWKKTLYHLKNIASLDVFYQENKIKDKRLCEATERLSGMLGQYTAVYNRVWDCLHNNLQVQKTRYINDVMGAVVSRILELKLEIKKLEVSETNFNSNSLASHKLTLYDAELNEIPERFERPDDIQAILVEAFKRVKEKKELLELEAAKAALPEDGQSDNWWDADEDDNENETEIIKKVEMSEEQIKIKQMTEMIQAQERSRQIITRIRQARNKRVKWEKELFGTLAPPAPYEIRERSAKLIQKVCRSYFEFKRQKHLQLKRDQYNGLRVCLKPELVNKDKQEQIKLYQIYTIRRKYNEELKNEQDKFKNHLATAKIDDIKEHYRDEIRDWFKTWYESIQFFHEIPEEKQGGAAPIFKEELPTPEEWLEEYKTYLIQKKANKNKTNAKLAKLEAKREEMERKREEHIRMRLEQELRKKMMKNPSMHPGYKYPISSKTDHLLGVIGKYHRDWHDLDATKYLDVKKRFVVDVAKNDAYAEAKVEILTTVENDMKNELKLLRKALKRDYENKGETMPEPMKRPKNKKGRKREKANKDVSGNISEKLENLIFRGFVKEYPRIEIKEFIGDPNFAGDDMRCEVAKPLPSNGEVRSMWWEKCREIVNGFHKILLVGPSGSGKTRLVHVLASTNDAVLFELDASTLSKDLMVGVFLDQLVRSMAACAKYFQPSVIHIKDTHKLFYKRVPPEDAKIDWKYINRYFVKNLFKYIQKTDKVTVLATCTDPWMSRNALLKEFPTVQLLPNASYGILSGILKNWVLSHTVIPSDFNISNLAYVLQGYSYGYLQDALERFMTGDTNARIAARGLSPMDVYDFIIQDNPDGKVEYENYLTWYEDNTAQGAREFKHYQGQLEFKQACAVYAERKQKKKGQQSEPSTPLHGSRENLA